METKKIIITVQVALFILLLLSVGSYGIFTAMATTTQAPAADLALPAAPVAQAPPAPAPAATPPAPAPAPAPATAPAAAPDSDFYFFDANSTPLMGVGLDQKVWKMQNLGDNWQRFVDTGLVTDVASTADGNVVGVGTDNNLWYRTPAKDWSQVPNSCCVKRVIRLRNGWYVGVGLGNDLWYRTGLNGSWVNVPNSCCVKGVTEMDDGTILAVGTNNMLYSKPSLLDTGAWQINSGKQNGCCVDDVAVYNGKIVGLGTNNLIYTRDSLASDWQLVGDGKCCVSGLGK